MATTIPSTALVPVTPVQDQGHAGRASGVQLRAVPAVTPGRTSQPGPAISSAASGACGP